MIEVVHDKTHVDRVKDPSERWTSKYQKGELFVTGLRTIKWQSACSDSALISTRKTRITHRKAIQWSVGDISIEVKECLYVDINDFFLLLKMFSM